MSDVNNKKNNLVQIVTRGLEEMDCTFSSRVWGDETVFDLPMAMDNTPGIHVKLIIDKNGDCKLRSYPASGVPMRKRRAMLRLVNELNLRFRYICLTLDDDGDICASYDFPYFEGSNLTFEKILATVWLYVEILDKCMPELMRTLWSETKPATPEAPRTIRFSLFDEDENEDEDEAEEEETEEDDE